MTTKLFVVGRSGGGKSTAIKHITEKVEKKIPVFHADDYPILFDMYWQEYEISDNERSEPKRENKLFIPSVPEKPRLGFNIVNIMHSPVWNIALQKLEQETQQQIQNNEAMGKDEFIILEFARRNYQEAFHQFTPEFLKNSHFLLVEAPISVSIDRIHKRAEERGEQFMGDAVIRDYFGIDSFHDMQTYEVVPGKKIECIWNDALSKEAFLERVNTFVEGTLLPSLG